MWILWHTTRNCAINEGKMCAKTEMRRFAIFLVVIASVVRAEGFLENNLTMPEVPVEVPNTSSDDDSEQELSSQLQEVDSRSGGWTAWSAWSACSRTCDGGVAHQLRTCRSGSCRGDHIRYKICNMQVFVAFAVLACANAGLIVQGPSSRSTVVGPDGSAISAVAPGGSIITEQHPGVVAHTAPVVAAPVIAHSAYAAPVLAHGGLLTHAAPLAYAGHHGIVAGHGLII